MPYQINGKYYIFRYKKSKGEITIKIRVDVINKLAIIVDGENKVYKLAFRYLARHEQKLTRDDYYDVLIDMTDTIKEIVNKSKQLLGVK